MDPIKEQINRLLIAKKLKSEELSLVAQQFNKLGEEISQIQDKINSLLLEARPTQVISVKKTKPRRSSQEVEQDKQLKKQIQELTSMKGGKEVLKNVIELMKAKKEQKGQKGVN